MINLVHTDFLYSGQWYSVLVILAQVLIAVPACDELYRDSYISAVASFFAQLGRYVPYVNFIISTGEYRACHQLLSVILRQLETGLFIRDYRLLMSAYTFYGALQMEFGNLHDAKHIFARSLYIEPRLSKASSYQQVLRRKAVITEYSADGKVHYATFASNQTSGLELLLRTASIAGIPLKVLGLGQPYNHFGDKIRSYHRYLNSSYLQPNDIAVLMDAYDVMVFSSIRRIGDRMKKATAAPVLACSESGIYPEFMAGFAYQQGAATPSLKARYLNSGCLVGKVWALRDIFAFAADHSYTINDDQQLIVRYHLNVPGIIALDSTALMMTAYKQYEFSGDAGSTQDFDHPTLIVTHDMDLAVIHNNTLLKRVAIFHANNKQSNALYFMVNATYNNVFEQDYEGGGKMSNNAKQLQRQQRNQKLREMWRTVDDMQV